MLEPYDPGDPSDQLEGLQNFNANGRLIDLYIAGDFNDNGIVDSGDTNILITHWGAKAPWANEQQERCDLDHDGVIGQGDLDILLAVWDTPESQTPADFTWNDAGQLVEIEPKFGDGNLKQVFTYDYLGRRVRVQKYAYDTGASAWETADSEDYKYVYDHGRLVMKLDANDANKILQTYGWVGGGAVPGRGLGIATLHEPNNPTITTDDETWLLAEDAHGNLALAVNKDTGALDLGWRYNAFGSRTELVRTANAPNVPFAASGMQRDEETGLLLTRNGNYFNVNTGMEIWHMHQLPSDGTSHTLPFFTEPEEYPDDPRLDEACPPGWRWNRDTNTCYPLLPWSPGADPLTGVMYPRPCGSETAWCLANWSCCVRVRHLGGSPFQGQGYIKDWMDTKFGEDCWKDDDSIFNALLHCALTCAIAASDECTSAQAEEIAWRHECNAFIEGKTPASRSLMDLHNNNAGLDCASGGGVGGFGHVTPACFRCCILKAYNNELVALDPQACKTRPGCTPFATMMCEQYLLYLSEEEEDDDDDGSAATTGASAGSEIGLACVRPRCPSITR